MSSLKIVVLAICGVILCLGLLVQRPAWMLAGAGGILAALLMPLEMPERM